MPIKPELEAWLKTVPFSADAQALIAKELEKEDVATKVRESVLARSDYSRHMDELRAKEQSLAADTQAKVAEAQSLLNSNVEWKKKNEGVLASAVRKAEQAEATLAAHQAKIRTWQEQGLLSEEDIADIAAARAASAQVPPSAPPPAETKKYVTPDEFNKEVANLVYGFANFNDIADEHQRLYGSPLKRTELVAEMMKSQQAGRPKSLEEVWEEKFKVSEKRKEIERLDWEKQKEDAIQAALIKDRSERSVSGPQLPSDLGSRDTHILSLFKDNKGGQHGVSEGVAAAANAYRDPKNWVNGEFKPGGATT